MEEKIIEITDEILELEDYLDMQIAVRSFGESLIKNDKMLIFVSDCALDEWADKNRYFDISELPIKMMSFAEAVIYAATNKVTLEIAGFYDELSVLKGLELKKAAQTAEIFLPLLKAAGNTESLKKAARKIREKTVFIHGTLPTDYKEGDRFGTETMKRKKGEVEYTAVPVFLNERSAKKQNPNEAPISSCRLCDVAFMYRTMFKILIEPYQRYAVELDAEDIL